LKIEQAFSPRPPFGLPPDSFDILALESGWPGAAAGGVRVPDHPGHVDGRVNIPRPGDAIIEAENEGGHAVISTSNAGTCFRVPGPKT